MKFTSDIDIDFADRSQILEHIIYVSASNIVDGELRKHNTGVYVTEIPNDPIKGFSSIDHKLAEERGYIKLDLLNVWVYKLVKNEQHLNELMKEPDWSMLKDRTTFEKLIHIGNHYDRMMLMPEPINSIPRMAMFLSVIRPGKKHLIGKTWSEVSKTIWEQTEEGYAFKRSHAISYAHLVVVNMNLLRENSMASV
jgi:hypothetical protein